MQSSTTTWTIGRVLDRVCGTGDAVVVYAGEQAYGGVVRGLGEYLVTLEDGDDVIVVELARISGIRLLGRASVASEYADDAPRATVVHLGDPAT